MGETFTKLPGVPAMTKCAGNHERTCQTLLISAWLGFAVVGLYLTTVVHPAFLPFLLLSVFVLCHVLVNPKQAKQSHFEAPVIRFASPKEIAFSTQVVQPTYKTMIKEEVPKKAIVNVQMSMPCATAYCNAQPSIPRHQAPVILVV